MDFKFLTDNVGRRVIVARPLGIANAAGNSAGTRSRSQFALNQTSGDGDRNISKSDLLNAATATPIGSGA
jgi:hypothetical protein